MTKKIEKLFKSYREQLLHLAKLYGVVEIKSYARSSKRLTISQLELLLIKNYIKLPVNRSSDKAIAKHELKQNTITNAYLSVFIIFCTHPQGGGLARSQPHPFPTLNEFPLKFRAQQAQGSFCPGQSRSLARRQKFVGGPPGPLVFAPVSSGGGGEGISLQLRAYSEKWKNNTTR